MTFSPVEWRFRDPVTSAKLAQMVDNIRDHDHREDGSQGKAYPALRVAAATQVESRTASGENITAVTFPAGRFTKPPRVVLSPSVVGGTYPPDGFSVRNVTATGFDAVLHRPNGTSSYFSWVAIERDS